MTTTKTKYCHGCQAELSLKEKRCPYCKQKQQTAFEACFWEKVRNIFPKNSPTTKILLVSIVIYFIVISIDILMHPDYGLRNVLLEPPENLVYRWGAHLRGETVWWRLITANFVHFGIIHIIFNLYALRYVAPYVERMFGSALTLASFVVLGTGSMLCSNLMGDAGLVAGASGGLMAFIGMAAIAAHREHTPLAIEVRNSMLKWAAFTMVFGLIVSLGGMGIDNIAHASGFIFGAIAGYILPLQSTTGFTRLWMIRTSRLALIASVLIVGFSFAQMGSASESTKHQQQCISMLKLKRFEEAEQHCQAAYKADKSQTISYHNYILVKIIQNDIKTAQSLCIEGRKRFKNQNSLSFDALCKSIHR